MKAFFELPVSVYVKLLIVSITVIIFCRWLVKKLTRLGRSKAYAINTTRLIYAGFIYTAFVWLVFKVITYEKRLIFSKDKWMTEKNKRYEMAEDLIQTGIIAGKDSNEVKALIGEPDFRNNTLQIWNYTMGEGGGGLGFMMHYLVIEFAADSVTSIWHQKIAD